MGLVYGIVSIFVFLVGGVMLYIITKKRSARTTGVSRSEEHEEEGSYFSNPCKYLEIVTARPVRQSS